MKIELSKKPKAPIIISGFPGFGLVGMIATEYLVNHLATEEIGRIWSEKLPPIAAIHDGHIVQPLQIFYNQKNNIVIVQGLGAAQGVEWEISDAIVRLADQLGAKEVISLDSIASKNVSGNKVYVYSTNPKKKASLSKQFEIMQKGVVVGITGAILINSENRVPATCFFAETMTGLPDSKAAAELIKAIDSYLGLKIDSKPLAKQAEAFEQKLRGLVQQGKEAVKINAKQQEETTYFG